MVDKKLATDKKAPATVGKTLDAMKEVCEDMVTELQLSFDYFENRFGHPPGEILISGGLTQSTDFVNAFKSHYPQKVSAWTPVQGLAEPFVIAYGLALRIE